MKCILTSLVLIAFIVLSISLIYKKYNECIPVETGDIFRRAASANLGL